MKPLCVNLFLEESAVSKAKALRSADASVKERMARRTENPKHIALSRRSGAPCSVSRKFRFVSDIQNAGFPTAFAPAREVWEFPAKPFDDTKPLLAARVFVFMPLPHFLVVFAVSFVKLGARLLRPLACAFRRTVSSVCTWRRYVEVFLTSKAFPARKSDVCLFSASNARRLGLAPKRAVFLIRPLGDKFHGALGADDIVHRGEIS